MIEYRIAPTYKTIRMNFRRVSEKVQSVHIVQLHLYAKKQTKPIFIDGHWILLALGGGRVDINWMKAEESSE